MQDDDVVRVAIVGVQPIATQCPDLQRAVLAVLSTSSSSSWGAAGCTSRAALSIQADAWVAQQARQLLWSLADRASPPRFLIHDRDTKLSRGFDSIFRSEGIEIVRTPIQAPNANAYAERWVGSVRRECLDRLLIVGRRQLEHVLHTDVDHYNGHRPHRGLGLVPPQPRPALRLVAPPDPRRFHGTDRLGGLIHECSAAA